MYIHMTIKISYHSFWYHIFRQPHMFATLNEPKARPSMDHAAADAAADGHSFAIYFLTQIYIIGIIDQTSV